MEINYLRVYLLMMQMNSLCVNQPLVCGRQQQIVLNLMVVFLVVCGRCQQCAEVWHNSTHNTRNRYISKYVYLRLSTKGRKLNSPVQIQTSDFNPQILLFISSMAIYKTQSTFSYFAGKIVNANYLFRLKPKNKKKLRTAIYIANCVPCVVSQHRSQRQESETASVMNCLVQQDSRPRHIIGTYLLTPIKMQICGGRRGKSGPHFLGVCINSRGAPSQSSIMKRWV